MNRCNLILNQAASTLAAVFLFLALHPFARAEEIWLADGSRIYGLISEADAAVLSIRMPDGSLVKKTIDEVVAIRFHGRDPRLVQAGSQEFRFVNGGSIRGQIAGNKGDLLLMESALAGNLEIGLSRFAGFVALPMSGFIGRKSDELIGNEPTFDERAAYQDALLDQRGSLYFGVLKKLDHINLDYYVEDLVKTVPIKVPFVAGVRLADAARDARLVWSGGDTQVRFFSRDDSVVRGKFQGIRRNFWQINPAWNTKETINLDVDEIALVQVLGGRTVYLSQLTPVVAKESTYLSPPQSYRADQDCQGNAISIAGISYPWGIGVHADSELTFDVNGAFEKFQSDVGIATVMGLEGSVIFSVLGDGRELYRSPLIRGADKKAVRVELPVAGVRKLTLKVANGGDLDLGDVANWGGAKLFRASQASGLTQP